MPESSFNIRILHLEDSARDAELVADLLRHEGLECGITRVDRREAFEAAVMGTTWELVLVDYNLPAYDGITALKFAREHQPGTPVIVLSGSMGEEEAVKCLKLGATDYLLKGRLSRFPAAVARALQEAEAARQRDAAERALRESEERFRQLAAAIDDVFWMTDVETGRLLYVSPAYAEMWGRPVESMVDLRTLLETVHPDDAARVAQHLARMSSGQPLAVEYRIVRPDGTVRWIWARGFPVRDDEGTKRRYAGVASDVTERKALEEQLHRVQRVESVGMLASGIAHDMNNILAPIMMAAPLLRLGLSPEETERTLATIEASAQRGAALVRQLVIFGRGVEGERRPVKVAEIIDEVARIARQTFPRNIAIHEGVSPTVWPVHGDASQLHQVVLNLCVNARDAMPDGGMLTLGAENVEIDAHYAAQFRDARPGRHVLLRVADTGQGIPPEIIDRIFDPFFTTKEVGKGTGLGLSTVLGIVRSHGGFVRLASQPGRGTTFEIHLPASPTAESERTESAAPVEHRGNGELILVVDDEEHIRTLLRETFVRSGYKVVTAQDGVDATAIFARHVKEVRLVVADLDMPLMDGANLTRVLRRMNPKVKVVISTGGQNRAMDDLEALEPSAILTKPYTAQKILAIAHEVIAAERT